MSLCLFLFSSSAYRVSTLGSAPSSSSHLGYTTTLTWSDISTMTSGFTYTSNTTTLSQGTYMVSSIYVTPTYSSAGSTIFTNIYYTLSGQTNVTMIGNSYNDGLTNRTTMVYGLASTYPFISLGPVLFSVNSSGVTVGIKLTLSFTYATTAAGLSGSGTTATIIRIA